MSDQYLGEIRIFGGNFAPSGWALCNGQLISISQNSALFAILGTTYGGDGVQTFALPNLQGRLPLHWGTSTTGSNYVLGEVSGSEKVTLLANNLPMHTHAVSIPVNSGPADLSDPTGAIESTPNDPASGNPISSYTKNAATGAALPFQSGIAGSSIPISVMQPFLCVTFIIALVGIFPSRG